MAWELLPTNYTDAKWAGLKRYNQISNEDGTMSFEDVTSYTDKENSFFGATEANKMNEALNTIMSMVEQGTDLYTAFQTYFDTQKSLFQSEMDTITSDFEGNIQAKETEASTTITNIKSKYQTDIDTFKDTQQQVFNMWFKGLQDQLDGDVAANLQNQINKLDVKTDGFDAYTTVISADGTTVTETYGTKKIVTEFASDTKIVQKLYENDTLTKTKTITFSDDGLTITEEVV